MVPPVFRVKFETSQGDVVVEATRAWAPHGVDRFHELVRMGYFTQGRFFRVVPGFIAQFGVHRDYDVHTVWRTLFIVDDPPQQKNVRGTLAFAQSGKNTRATEIFINLGDNTALDEQGFVPFARSLRVWTRSTGFTRAMASSGRKASSSIRARWRRRQRVPGSAVPQAGLHQAGDYFAVKCGARNFNAFAR